MDSAEVSAQFQLFDTPVRWPQPAASWLYNPEGATSAMPPEAAFEAITLGAEGWDNAGNSGWQDFKFFNPQTKKVEPKRMYWEKHDNIVFAAGAYKPN